MNDAIVEGRAALAGWLDAQSENFFEDADVLQALIARDWSEADQARFWSGLQEFGAVAAGPLDEAVRENNLHRNLPVLDPYDGIGRRERPVDHHPSYHDAGRYIYGSGVMASYAEEPSPHQYILALFFLSSHVGEGGHNCPLACTAGAIRVLQRVASPEQRERYLPPLLDPDWDLNHSGAQFLTEVQGGSDVGGNGTRAELQEDGTWRIHGEKWFCSNVDGDVILMTARVPGSGPGTRGLGLFLVPAITPDGEPNGYRVRRLKDKLGTRSMASGEVDFLGAYAEAIGPVDRGFRNMMQEVINTSRLYNAFSVAGIAQRAVLVATTYAAFREAFGGPILRYPLVRETLAWMNADSAGILAGSWLLAGMWQRMDRGELSEAERAFFRVAVNVNKMVTAIHTHDVANRGIEILGGNGAIESFSVLPRLLRDNVVCENWEGTHNTLCLQVLRDCQRYQLHEGFFATLEGLLGAERIAPEREALEAALSAPAELATLRIRRVCERLGVLVQLAGLAGLEQPIPRACAELLAARRLDGLGAADDRYLSLLDTCIHPVAEGRA
ncbi:MAG: acyl-CoA dehydrogenase family protein [Alphaproteobacteria bacterium]|nr:acyl-CoA dehydrogenase family protein [Alphaproteobacteria bacterium]MCB9791422.1 acyl-CoA dehydrogenase family protein [Alphaproteobacteria bacterium]